MVLAAIEVRPVPDRTGQILVSALRDQLNPQGVQLKTRYILTIGLTIVRADLGLRRDNTSTAGELTMNADLSLSDQAGKTVVFHDLIRTVTSFNLPDDAYAAVVAEQNARREAVTSLGREIAERLAIYLRRQRDAGGA
jgi:hypothetical protein